MPNAGDLDECFSRSHRYLVDLAQSSRSAQPGKSPRRNPALGQRLELTPLMAPERLQPGVALASFDLLIRTVAAQAPAAEDVADLLSKRAFLNGARYW